MIATLRKLLEKETHTEQSPPIDNGQAQISKPMTRKLKWIDEVILFQASKGTYTFLNNRQVHNCIGMDFILIQLNSNPNNNTLVGIQLMGHGDKNYDSNGNRWTAMLFLQPSTSGLVAQKTKDPVLEYDVEFDHPTSVISFPFQIWVDGSLTTTTISNSNILYMQVRFHYY